MVRQQKTFAPVLTGTSRPKLKPSFRRSSSLSNVPSPPSTKQNNTILSNNVFGGASSNNSLSASTSMTSLKGVPSNTSSTEHDDFLRSFQIPTTLYRYLARRHKTRPVLLHRTLAYIRRRSTSTLTSSTPRPPTSSIDGNQTTSRRALDECISRLTSTATKRSTNLQEPSTSCCSSVLSDASLKLHLEGFFDSHLERDWITTQASLSVSIVHHWVNKRKGLSGQLSVPLVTNHRLSCTRLDPHSPSHLVNGKRPFRDRRESGREEAVEISMVQMTQHDRLPGRIIDSLLSFRVDASEKRTGDNSIALCDTRRRPSKPGARRTDGYPVSYQTSIPVLSHRGGSRHTPGEAVPITEDLQSSLLEGQYELRLNVDWTKQSPSPHRPRPEWQPLSVSMSDCSSISEYQRWPVLKFTVQWPSALTTPDSQHSKITNGVVSDDYSSFLHSFGPSPPLSAPPPGSVRVSYRFLHSGRVHQWTQSEDLVCPWCRRRCSFPRALVEHLRHYHPRFQFKDKIETTQRSTVANGSGDVHVSLDVSISDTFDCSNDCGLRRHTPLTTRDVEANDTLGCHLMVARRPVHRLSYTHLIYWSGMATDVLNSESQPYRAVGHKRTYMHSTTALPIRPSEFHENQDNNKQPPWLFQHYIRKVADFTDLNKGEKLVMQLWNCHLLRHTILADCHLPSSVDAFIREQGPILKAAGVRGNLLFHLGTLVDHGLLSPDRMEGALVTFDALPQPTFQLCPTSVVAYPAFIANLSKTTATAAKLSNT